MGGYENSDVWHDMFQAACYDAIKRSQTNGGKPDGLKIY